MVDENFLVVQDDPRLLLPRRRRPIDGNFHIGKKADLKPPRRVVGQLALLVKPLLFGFHRHTIEGQDLEVIDNLYYSMTNGFSGKLNLNFDEKSTFTKVNYFSSDESVAVIGKDGTITPMKVGETIIKVTCDDGMQNKIEFEIKLKIKKQDYIKNVTDFIYKVRKGLGHFSAFLILGIVSTFTWLLFFRGKKLLFSIPLNYITGFIIACLTELIQVYVPGRCGLFDDVILDYNGFIVSSSILTVLIIIHQIRTYVKFKKQDI